MTPEQVGSFIGTAAAAGFALWRAIHADKVASRVEAKTDATAGATGKSLERGNTAFQQLRDQNLAQAEKISGNSALILALEVRVTSLEKQLRELISPGGAKEP